MSLTIAVYSPEGGGNALIKQLLKFLPFEMIVGGTSLPFERAGKACRYVECHWMGLWPVVCDIRKFDFAILNMRVNQ